MSRMFSPSKWQRTKADASLQPSTSTPIVNTSYWYMWGMIWRRWGGIDRRLFLFVAVTKKTKTIESSEPPPISILHPQSVSPHAISAHFNLVRYHIHRLHALVGTIHLFMYVSDRKSRDGAIWWSHRKQDFGYGSFDGMNRFSDPDHFNALNTHQWTQLQRLGATEVVHGTGNNLRVNFGWLAMWR